jgi:hypothetical protein
MNFWRKKKKMPKVLTQLRIDEVSAVDRGAGDGVRIMLMKRNDAETPEQIFKTAADALVESLDSIMTSGDSVDQKRSMVRESVLQCKAHLTDCLGPTLDLDLALDQLDGLGKSVADALSAITQQPSPDRRDLVDDPEPDVDDDLVGKVVEMHDGKISRAQALEWIRGTPTGRELHRHHLNKGNNPMSTTEIIRKIAASGDTTMSEGELVDLVSNDAPLGTRPDVYFAKMYSQDQGLRRAIQIAKGNVGALSRDVSKNVRKAAAPELPATGSGTAYDELSKIAAEYRDSHPELTEAQAFAKVYTNPANKDLAVRQRDEHFASE